MDVGGCLARTDVRKVEDYFVKTQRFVLTPFLEHFGLLELLSIDVKEDSHSGFLELVDSESQPCPATATAPPCTELTSARIGSRSLYFSLASFSLS